MAASFLGKLLVKIEGDNSDLDKSIDKSEGSVKKFSKLAVAAYAVVGVAIIAVGKKLSTLAAGAEEIRSKFNTVFGATAREIRNWAKTYSDAVGRSETDTLAFLSSVGDLLKPLGFAKEDVDGLSKSFVTLANDVGSFNDVPTADVIRDFNAAITGSPETVKKYGVVVNEATIKAEAFASGIGDGITRLTAQEKALATYNLILKGTTDAQGDLLRTQDSNTNVMRRLANANKELGIVLGDTINEGLTPMAKATGTLVIKFTEWLKKSKEINDIMAEVGETGKTTATDVELLTEAIARQNQVIIQGEAQANRQGAARGLELQREQLAILEEQLRIARQLETAQAREAAVRIQFAGTIKEVEFAIIAQAAAEAEALKFTEARVKAQAELGAEFIKIDEAAKLGLVNAEVEKRKALQTTLNDLIEFGFTAEGKGIENILGFAEQRNVLLNEQDEIVLKLHEDTTVMFGTVDAGLDNQIDKLEEVNQTYLALAEDGLGAFASSFTDITEKSVSGWDVIKQAGKDAISSFLIGLSKMAVTEAALAFVRLDIPRGIGFLAAASGAVAAAGFVQNLAEGGVIQPATGGVPAVMAEAGVPEMAMPLTSSAINPFADAVANRISTTTNNNTQNFNSMFSLNDENKIREVARRLFPFLRDEEQRRGILV